MFNRSWQEVFKGPGTGKLSKLLPGSSPIFLRVEKRGSCFRLCYQIIAELAALEARAAQLEVVVTHQAEKIWTYDRTTDRTRYYFQHARLTVLRALSLPLRNGRAMEKVMRRRNSVRNSESPLVCARRHRQMTMKCAYSSVEFQCSVPWAHGRHCTRASRGLVDVKPRKQIICNPRFEREIKLVRLQLNSNSQYFAISNQLAKQQYQQS